MLKGLLKSNEEKVKAKVAEHLKEGMRMLNEKFFNGAMVEFDKAMALSPELASPKLQEEMDKFAATGQLESALSIGSNLIKTEKENYELANKLGNIARELQNYPQAEGLYKLALKIKPNYEPAFYNLAASNARVEKYDESIKSSLRVFNDVTDYILPDMIGPEKLLEHLSAELDSKKSAEIEARTQELKIQKDQKINEGDKMSAERIDFELQKLKDTPKHASNEEIIQEFKKMAEQASPDTAGDHYFNLAIFALSTNKLDIAADALNRLPADRYDHLELLQAILKAKQGNLDEGSEILIKLLGQNEYSRYCNVNLGLMYKKSGKKFLSVKYLIKTASLLEKSGGIYSMKELVKQAHAAYDAEEYVKAMNFYKIACTENPDALLWERMGNIYVANKKYDEATKCYRKILEMEPDSEIAKIKIREMHDYYFEKCSALFLDNKFKPAADYVHKALGVARYLETLQMAAKIYLQLKQPEKADEYRMEYLKMEEEEKQRQLEVDRQSLIQQAKVFMAKKNYLKATECYESALRMKLDKQVFMQLAAIYKGLKKHGELQDLVRRWEKMVEHDEKLKRYEKERERQAQEAKEAREAREAEKNQEV